MNDGEMMRALSTYLKETEVGQIYRMIRNDSNLVSSIGFCEMMSEKSEGIESAGLSADTVRSFYVFLGDLARKHLNAWFMKEECYLEYHPEPKPGESITACVFHIGHQYERVWNYIENCYGVEVKALKFHSFCSEFDNMALYYCLIDIENPGIKESPETYPYRFS